MVTEASGLLYFVVWPRLSLERAVMFPGEPRLLYKFPQMLCWANQVQNLARHGTHLPDLKLQNVPLSLASMTSQRMLRTVWAVDPCPCP